MILNKLNARDPLPLKFFVRITVFNVNLRRAGSVFPSYLPVQCFVVGFSFFLLYFYSKTLQVLWRKLLFFLFSLLIFSHFSPVNTFLFFLYKLFLRRVFFIRSVISNFMKMLRSDLILINLLVQTHLIKLRI